MIKKRILHLLLFMTAVSPLSVIRAQSNTKTADKPASYYLQSAPFKMPSLSDPVIPQRKFYLKDFGGVADGTTLNTAAFSKAIKALTAAGGGQLIVSQGTWLTGPIELKSNMDLHVEEGAVIQFTGDHTQFPMRASGKKFEVTPPLYGTKLKNVSITGKGVFDGAGETWRPLKKSKVSATQWQKVVASGGVLSADGKIWWPSAEALNGDKYLKSLGSRTDLSADDYLPARDYLRPKMVVITNSENILLDGPTFRNSPQFGINPQRITNLILRNIYVHNDGWAQNGDAIDISASRNVLIYNCMVNAGDDGICMKSSGSTADNNGLENVVIAECTVFEGHGGFVIGSNTDAGMNNIYVANCRFDGTDNGIRVKSNTGRGGLVRNIFVDNIFMKDIKDAAVTFDTYYEDVPAGKVKSGESRISTGTKVPEFTGFSIKNIICTGAAQAMFFRGLPEMPVHDLYFENVQIKSQKGVSGQAVKNIQFKNVNIQASDEPAVAPEIASEIKAL